MSTKVPCLLKRSLESLRRDDETDSWIFDFGEGYVLQVAAPWRLIKDGRIELGNCDHRQKFGLPQPVDVETAVCDLVRNDVVFDAVITDTSADLSVNFGTGVRLEIFNSSSGYEGWILNLPEGRFLVAQGGGRLVESNGR